MIYLILAILSSALISVLMRLSKRWTSGGLSLLAANYLMCLILAGCFTGLENLFPQTAGIGKTGLMGAVNGALALLSFALLQLNVRRNGVVLSAIFMKLGLLVPMVVAIFVFGELPGVVQVIGFVIAIGAIILMNLEQEDTAVTFKLGLVLLLLAGGVGDAMSKVYEELGDAALSEQFLFYTFIAALALCVALMLYKKERPGKAELIFGLLIGVPNYFSFRFLLKSLDDLNAVVVYPTYSVATIVLVTLAGVVFFRERLGKRQWIGLAAILVALVLLNI